MHQYKVMLLPVVDWVAPVQDNEYKARCTWCPAVLRAHYKDLTDHAKSTKHIKSACSFRSGSVNTNNRTISDGEFYAV